MMDISTLIQLSEVYAKERMANLRQVPVKIRQGIGAACYYAFMDAVRIDPAGERDTAAVIFCDLCHEFAHAYQREKLGLVKYLLLKTFCRSKIEEEAERIGLDACSWFLERLNKCILSKK